MSNVNNDIPFSTAQISKSKSYELNNTEGNRESTSLIEALTSLHNSNHELYKGNPSGGFPPWFNQVWQWLRTTSDGQVSVKNGNNEEGTELQTILTEGENLRRQADLLSASEVHEIVTHDWKGSILQRCLVGVGLMGAAGYAGYRYYNARTPSGSQQSTRQPSNTIPDFVTKGRSHGGDLGDSFGHHALHHDDPANRTRHGRRHLPMETSSTPQQINSPDDVRVEPVEICYKYFGMGRVGGKKKVPCANKINSNKRVNNKRPGQPAYPYVYTTDQPRKCKTQNQEQKCQKTHQSLHKKHPNKKMRVLVLNVGKTQCLCPPPQGDNVRLITPQLQKKKVLPFTVKIPASKAQMYTSASSTVSSTEKGAFTSLTEKPASPHQTSLFIPLPEKRFIISPYLGKGPATLDNASSVAPMGGGDNVKIEKMYDFSCIDERNNMSWADIIRQVGKTLRSPVQLLAAESQVIQHHNTLRKGCPSEQESLHLREITGKVDAVLSQVMQLFPGANPLIVLQQIVGPVLETYADGLDGKPLDHQKINDINQQVLFLSRQMIQTLTAKDMSRLYNEVPETFDGGNITPEWKAFTSKGGGLYITLEGKEYKILHAKLGNFVFIEKDGQTKRAYFVKKENRWDFFNQKDILHLSQLDLMESYGAELNNSPWLENADLTLDKSNPEIMEVNHDGVLSKHIIMNGYLIPIEEIKLVNQITTTVAVNRGGADKKVLIQGEYGWQFEQDSTSMDEYLDLILGSIENTGLEFSADNKFSFIKGDAFSYNNIGVPYVKYRGKYYEVNSFTPDVYAFKDGPGNYFITSNGKLKLRSSTDILDFNDKVTASVSNLGDGTNLYLEGVAYDDLIETGIELPDAEPDLKVGPGVYVDKEHRFFFAANNKYFLLKRYTGKEIELENNIQGSNELKLFRSGNIFLKVRDNEIPTIKYKKILACRGVRSPTLSGAGCSSVWMEEDLVSIFNENIASKTNAKKSVTDSSVVNSNDASFPNLFHSVDSGKLYYLHEGHYFNAEWVSTDEANNPIGRPGLNVFTSGCFFRRKRIIATIMSEKKEERIEIKTFSGFIHENVNVRKGIAQAYLNKLKYQNIRNIKNIDGVIEELNCSGEFTFPAIKSFFSSDLDETALQTYIKKEFYPPRIINDDRYIIKVIKPNEFEDHDLFSLRAGALKVRNHVRFIKDSMLPLVLMELKKGNSNYNYYVGEVFKTDNAAFISGFMNEMEKRITRLNENIIMDNIYLCDVYRKTVDGVNSVGEPRLIETKEKLLPQERTGTFAFALSDKSKRIFISLDKLYFVDPTSPDLELRQDPATDLTTTLLHEASHLNGMTMDYVYFPRENGKIYPILDSIDSMTQKIDQGKLVDTKSFKKMSSDYINSIPLLKSVLSNPLKMNELSYLTSHDKAYLSRLLLNTADGVALLIQDLYTIAQTGKIIE